MTLQSTILRAPVRVWEQLLVFGDLPDPIAATIDGELRAAYASPATAFRTAFNVALSAENGAIVLEAAGALNLPVSEETSSVNQLARVRETARSIADSDPRHALFLLTMANLWEGMLLDNLMGDAAAGVAK